MPVDYQKGKIYKLVNLDTDECYIGSTCEPTLARRLAKHVANYKRYQEGKHTYMTSYKILESDNYDIQLIENYPCDSKDQLHSREGHWIKQTDCVNKYVAGRNVKQWYQDNKEVVSEKRKQYRKSNGDKLREISKQYYNENKEMIKEKYKKLYQDNKEAICEKTNQYKKANKDKVSESGKKYHNDNKDKINERHRKHYNDNKSRFRQKIECECGGTYSMTNKTNHLKTKKHQTFVNV